MAVGALKPISRTSFNTYAFDGGKKRVKRYFVSEECLLFQPCAYFTKQCCHVNTRRYLTRETSLVKGLDGLGDVGAVEGHLVLGTEGIDIGLAPVGDGSVLLVKVLF